MNRLSVEKRSQILHMLCEGMSMRSVSRIADVSINTVSKLLVEAGEFCSKFHDEKVRGVEASKVQCDEVWSFTYAKAKNVRKAKAAPLWAGDTWTWTGIEQDSKLIISWLVGGRDSEYATAFMADLANRIENRVQLTTDGHRPYLEAVESAFGGGIDFAQLIKIYGATDDPKSPERRYSPSEFVCAEQRPITGNPDPDHIITSHAERLNLSFRMGMRRYTRLSNAFSKKFRNHCHMVAIWGVWYNWIRFHKSLRMTPAMAAGLTDTTMEWVEIIEAMDAASPPKKRGPYKKRAKDAEISK